MRSINERECFNSGNDVCAPTCRKFGGDHEASCQLRRAWTDDELVKEYGLESMKNHLEEHDYLCRKVERLLEEP